MDLALLATYRAILASGTTQGAARQLGLSQPAVSRRLAQLETELGLALFTRDRGRLVPTRESRMLEHQIGRLLDHGARLGTRAREIASGRAASGTLRIAVPGSMTLAILPAILQDFLAEHGQVQVEVHTGAYDTIERMLLDERAEVGFLRVPTQRNGLETTPAIEAQTVCVMPRGHALSGRASVSVRDLFGQPLILLARMRLPRRDIDELFWQAGLRPDVRIEAHSVMSAVALAAQGLGVTLVNALMARDYAHLPVDIRPFAEPLPHRFAFATSAEAPVTDTARAFIACASGRLRAICAA